MKVNLIDVLTSHSVAAYGYRTFSPFVKPKFIEYVDKDQDISVYTDKSIANLDKIRNDKAKFKVAWLVEAREVHPKTHEIILAVEREFDYIFTFDRHLLKRGSKYKKNLIASSRIIDRHAKIYKKTKNFSMIVSKKRYCSGHQLRHHIVSNLKNINKVDMWGEAFKSMPQGAKALALAEYRYSITVENSKSENYFTEKLIDCFRMGTVPIYWGSESIKDYFNMDGIIYFEEISELDAIFAGLTEEKYVSMLPAIKENYELAKKWTSMDDTFGKNLKEVIYGEKIPTNTI